MKKLVVLSGAGISAESGLKTFRDSDGLWEGHDVTEVATPEGWRKNPELVLEFYNQRRKQALEAKPNKAHQILAELEDHFDVTVITQNVDNFHEQAGPAECSIYMVNCLNAVAKPMNHWFMKWTVGN